MELLGTLIACLATLPGCGAPPAAEELRAPLPPVSSFAISYKRGGGFAASSESLAVRPGRQAVARSSGTRAGDRKVSFVIGKGRVRALQVGLAAADFGSIEGGETTSCADCYQYSIAYLGHRVTLVEPDVPARLDDVIGELQLVVSARTIPPKY